MIVTSTATASRRDYAGNFVRRCCLLGTVAALSLASFGAVAQAPEKAGIAAGVAGKVQISEGVRKAPEPVKTGMEVLMRDRVQSENAGRMQVLLMDETVFTIGPNSDLVIDEFVYDPSTGAGKVTANFTKGMLRYVSGKVAAASPGNVTIRTATATIGVRGTSLFIVDAPGQGAEGDEDTQFIGLLGPGDKNDGNLKAGGLTVTGGGVSVDVLRAGNGVFTTPGQPVGPVVPTPPEILQLVANGMTGQLPSDDGAAAEGEGEGEGEEGEGDSSAADSSGSDTAEAGASAGDVGVVAGTLGDTGETAAVATANANTDEIVESVEEMEDIVAGGSFALGALFNNSSSGELPVDTMMDFLIALQWSNINDVDLHLTGPGEVPAVGPTGPRFHVYYGSDGSFAGFPFALLDDDQSAGSGVSTGELLGVMDSEAHDDGTYQIFAFNFTDDSDTSTGLSDPANNLRMTLLEDATISRGPGGTTVVSGTIINSITPPPGLTGHTWHAFDIVDDGESPDGIVNVINEISTAHEDGFGVPLD